MFRATSFTRKAHEIYIVLLVQALLSNYCGWLVNKLNYLFFFKLVFPFPHVVFALRYKLLKDKNIFDCCSVFIQFIHRRNSNIQTSML